MQRHWKIVALAATLGACAAAPPTGLLDEARGAVSQTLCSKVFVSGLDPEVVYRENLRPEPGMALIGWAIRYEVDRSRREVRTRIGGKVRRSVFREGRGCTLVYDGAPEPAALLARPSVPAVLPEIAPPEAVAPQGALAAAMDAAFAGADGAPGDTRAVVIMQRGRVVAERYAPGYGVDTPVLGHSMSKSVINALVGILVREGRLDVRQPAPIAAWRGDPRSAVTIDQLLRMDAGFGFDEGAGPGIATHIWHTAPDTAAASATATLLYPPGARWGYSSRSYVLLSRIVADALGDPQAVKDFAQRELFDPLGIHSMVMQFDNAGTPMGANAFLATPRDWARFGELYRLDGVVGGRRILPEGWVKYSATPTGASGYGAGFWLNTTDAPIPEWHSRWGLPGAPRDVFFARGYLGQYAVIAPSAELVVVRIGASNARNSGAVRVGALVRDAIAALR